MYAFRGSVMALHLVRGLSGSVVPLIRIVAGVISRLNLGADAVVLVSLKSLALVVCGLMAFT